MKIKLLVMDVDGTLTDGRIYVGAQGEVMKAFDVRDGYAIAHVLPVHGIVPVIITGRSSEIVVQRAKELKITELYQGVSDKLAKLQKAAAKYGATPEEIAYIGDDLNDLPCIRTGLKKIPISLDIPTLLRMSQLDLARILTENIVKNGYFQDIATGRNAAFTTGRSSWGLLYLIFA